MSNNKFFKKNSKGEFTIYELALKELIKKRLNADNLVPMNIKPKEDAAIQKASRRLEQLIAEFHKTETTFKAPLESMLADFVKKFEKIKKILGAEKANNLIASIRQGLMAANKSLSSIEKNLYIVPDTTIFPGLKAALSIELLTPSQIKNKISHFANDLSEVIPLFKEGVLLSDSITDKEREKLSALLSNSTESNFQNFSSRLISIVQRGPRHVLLMQEIENCMKILEVQDPEYSLKIEQEIHRIYERIKKADLSTKAKLAAMNESVVLSYIEQDFAKPVATLPSWTEQLKGKMVNINEAKRKIEAMDSAIQLRKFIRDNKPGIQATNVDPNYNLRLLYKHLGLAALEANSPLHNYIIKMDNDKKIFIKDNDDFELIKIKLDGNSIKFMLIDDPQRQLSYPGVSGTLEILRGAITVFQESITPTQDNDIKAKHIPEYHTISYTLGRTPAMLSDLKKKVTQAQLEKIQAPAKAKEQSSWLPNFKRSKKDSSHGRSAKVAPTPMKTNATRKTPPI